jgi:hypothetical protein
LRFDQRWALVAGSGRGRCSMVVVKPSTVTAVFDNRTVAGLAVDALTKTDGVHPDCVSLLFGVASPERARKRPDRRGGAGVIEIAARAFRLGSDPFYAEVLRRGDVVVLVRVDGGDTADLASDTLKRFGAIDVDAR